MPACVMYHDQRSCVTSRIKVTYQRAVDLDKKATAVVFGAGNVGRGFLGQLFSESGYRVILVDIDEPLLQALNARNGYPLHLVDNERHEELWIAPVHALHAGDTAAVAAAVASAQLMATSAGVRALPAVARTVAAGLNRRLSDPDAAPLNIIVCENLKDAAAYFRGLVEAELEEPLRALLAQRVGFVDTVIGRMVPLLTPEQRAADPAFIMAEPYKELPVDAHAFVGPVPDIVGLEPCDHFAAYVARKLYVHNLGHAVLAYLGYLRGHTYGYEALEDERVRPVLEAAWAEARAGIVQEHGVAPAWLEQHAADLRRRFANRALGDTVIRLARDPVRKLAAEDRLVGAARLAERAGVTPVALSWAIAAGYLFDSAEDPIALRLQQQIASEGLPAVLLAVSGIAADETLGRAVLSAHARLKAGEWP
ncbi:MAG: mannitol dehydrogenase [Anaerolineae bacterium]